MVRKREGCRHRVSMNAVDNRDSDGHGDALVVVAMLIPAIVLIPSTACQTNTITLSSPEQHRNTQYTAHSTHTRRSNKVKGTVFLATK